MNNIEQRVKWIQDKVIAAGAKGVVMAISGGVDSSVVAVLAKKPFLRQYIRYVYINRFIHYFKKKFLKNY